MTSQTRTKYRKLLTKMPKGGVRELAKQFGYTRQHIYLILSGQQEHAEVINAAIQMVKREIDETAELTQELDNIN